MNLNKISQGAMRFFVSLASSVIYSIVELALKESTLSDKKMETALWLIKTGAIAIGIGLLTYAVLYALKIYVERVLEDKHSALSVETKRRIEGNENSISFLNGEQHVLRIINFELMQKRHTIKDMRTNGVKVNPETIHQEIHSVRENLRTNRKKYDIDLRNY